MEWIVKSTDQLIGLWVKVTWCHIIKIVFLQIIPFKIVTKSHNKI